MMDFSIKLRTKGTFLGLFILTVCFVSCENSEAELVYYEVQGQNAAADLDASSSVIQVSFPEGFSDADELSANFILSEGADAFVRGIQQSSGITQNNYEKPFSFRVVSEDEKTSVDWTVKPSNNDFTERWGMGGFLKLNVSHNRDYEWYINQAETGTFSDVNCAPSSVVMVSHWRNENFAHSVEDARSMYHPEGGGWYTEDINNCLEDFGIDHSIIELATAKEETGEILMKQLDDGNILMICIDIHYLRKCENDSVHVDKFYDTLRLGIGHCIVIKGYKIVDGELFFEIYDPAGYNSKYADGQSKGKDRYYRRDDIFTATFGRWNYAFVIMGSNSRKSNFEIIESTNPENILIL